MAGLTMARVAAVLCAAAGAVAIMAAAASANDSTAELRAGGLHLTRSDAIEMVSEDLYLSTEEVRVRYVFRNITKADVTARVAFPLPDIDGSLLERDVGIASEGANFVDFKTTVDGKPLALEVEMRAVLENGLDVTERVRGAGLPVLPIGEAWFKAVADLNADLARALTDEGVLDISLDDSGRKVEYAYPLWTAKTTFHRMQTFPAGQDVVVEHTYKPVVGGTLGSLYSFSRDSYSEDMTSFRAEMDADYCVDTAFTTAAERMLNPPGDAPAAFIVERTMGYVLKTGANWARPIGTFHVTIEKDEPSQIISLCMDGLRKTSPTRFEATFTDFTPTEDIRILMLTPHVIPADPE